MNTCFEWSHYCFKTCELDQHFLLCFCHESSLTRIDLLLEQYCSLHKSTQLYLMQTMCVLWWLYRHKSRHNCGLYLWKLHIVCWVNWKCQFLSETLSESTTFELSMPELNLILIYKTTTNKQTNKKQNRTKHKICIFCICFLTPSQCQTPPSQIIFWPSWNPRYIQQKCASCWEDIFLLLLLLFLDSSCKQEVT